MINLSLTIESMLAAAFMQQKCKIREMSDTIRLNWHRKICTEKSEKIEKILTFLKILMQFFYNVRSLVDARYHSLFGGSVVHISTNNILGSNAPSTWQRGSVRIQFGRNGRRTEGGEDESDAFFGIQRSAFSRQHSEGAQTTLNLE